MNKLILLFAFCFLLSCFDDEHIQRSQLLITISGDQTATFQIYNEDKSVLLGRFFYDYNERKILSISMKYSGVIYISAISATQIAYNEYFTIQSGKTTEICLLF